MRLYCFLAARIDFINCHHQDQHHAELQPVEHLLKDQEEAHGGTAGGRTGGGPHETVWQVPAPVFPIILYHGARRWTLPTSVAEAYDLPADLVAQGLLDFRYSLVDLGAIPDAELSRHPPLQAGLLVLMYAMRGDDPFETPEGLIGAAADAGLAEVVLVVRYLFKASDMIDRDRLQAVVPRILPGQGGEVVTTVAEQLMAEGLARGLAEGKAKGLAEGETRGRAAVLLRQLARRFGPIAPPVEGRIRAADTHQLDLWSDRILEARTLDQVFAADHPH